MDVAYVGSRANLLPSVYVVCDGDRYRLECCYFMPEQRLPWTWGAGAKGAENLARALLGHGLPGLSRGHTLAERYAREVLELLGSEWVLTRDEVNRWFMAQTGVKLGKVKISAPECC